MVRGGHTGGGEGMDTQGEVRGWTHGDGHTGGR